MRFILPLAFFCSTFTFLRAAVLKTNSTDTLKRNFRSEDKYPNPPSSINRLFYVQRDPNANTIIYELNTGAHGELDHDNPVHGYWVKYADHGQKEEFNFIQRKFAYGLIEKPMSNGKFDIRFVSYKKFPLTLMKANDGKYHIFATIAQKQVVLNKVFIKIEGGSFWLPNVIYVELRGTDLVTGKEIVERFKP
jgi:hypothetical protein